MLWFWSTGATGCARVEIALPECGEGCPARMRPGYLPGFPARMRKRYIPKEHTLEPAEEPTKCQACLQKPAAIVEEQVQCGGVSSVFMVQPSMLSTPCLSICVGCLDKHLGCFDKPQSSVLAGCAIAAGCLC